MTFRPRPLLCAWIAAAIATGPLAASAAPARAAAVSPATLKADQAYLDGANAERRGDLAAADRAYRAGISADPTLASNYFAVADLDIRAARYGDAQIQLARLVARLPREPYAHYYLALVQHRLHQDGVAVENLDAELRLRPGFAPARNARALIVARVQHDRQLDLVVRRATSDRARRLALAFATPSPASTRSPPSAVVRTPAPPVAGALHPPTSAPTPTPRLVAPLPGATKPAGGVLVFDERTTNRVNEALSTFTRGFTGEFSTTSTGAAPILGIALGEFRAGDIARATIDASRAATFAPEDARARYVYGLLLMLGRNVGAVGELTAAVRLGGPPEAAQFLKIAEATVLPPADE